MIPNINIITRVIQKFQWKIELNMYDPKIVNNTSTIATPMKRNEWMPSPTLPSIFLY